MPDHHDLDFGRHASRLRLETLVRLRWLAVAGQTLAVLFVAFGLGFRVPIAACMLAIIASVTLNAVLTWRFPVSYRLRDRGAAAVLAFDILQLGGLLFMTGGLQNPFAMFFLAPVMISATALKPRHTMALGLFAVAVAAVLIWFSWPLPWAEGQTLASPLLYRVGIWFAILLGTAFIGAYAWRVADESRKLAGALTATELVLAREQHLSQLDGLAAAAAHELGTPLATIALVVKELEGMVPKGGAMAEDIALLREQVGRCRDILGKLNSLGTENEGPMISMRLSHLVEEVAGPHRPFGVTISVSGQGTGDEPSCRRNPAILYGLGNLVENAVDFAESAVVIATHWTHDRVLVSIEDDGPGFPADVLTRLGEPYLTSRSQQRHAKGDGGGLGLGLFIAKTLLERSGAMLVISNREASKGAKVQVSWPRLAFERDIVLPASPKFAAFQL
jgi:two-component system sensor histidine kinase RegB